MRLVIDDVTCKIIGASTKKVIESHFKDFCRRGVGGNMAAEFTVGLVGAHNHCQCIPANQIVDALFEFDITRVRRLFSNGYRIAIGRVGQAMGGNTQTPRSIQHLR